MTIQDLLKYSIQEVLNDKHLLSEFKDLYKSQHGVYPTCSSCAIASEIRTLLESQNKTTINQMDYKFKSPKGEILTFVNVDGKKVRCYDTNLNDDFVKGFLTINDFTTDEEIEFRKSLFKVLPTLQEEIKEVTTVVTEENIEVVVEPKKRASKKKK
jgi:hypothetical protein